jgi:hypothetical protein
MVRRMHKFKAFKLFLRSADADMHGMIIQGKVDFPFLMVSQILKKVPYPAVKG